MPNRGFSGERAQRSEVRCKPGYAPGARWWSAPGGTSETATERGKGRPGNPRRGTRAAAEVFIGGYNVEGATGTARNRALDRPGAWALRGRVWIEAQKNARAKERTAVAEDGTNLDCAARGAKRRGAGFDEMAMARRETAGWNAENDVELSAPNPFSQRPRRGSPVVRRADPAGPDVSKCTTVRRDLPTFLGAHNVWRQWRAQRVHCTPGLDGRGPTRWLWIVWDGL